MTPDEHHAQAQRYLEAADDLYDGWDDHDTETVAHLTMLGTLAQAHAAVAQLPAPAADSKDDAPVRVDDSYKGHLVAMEARLQARGYNAPHVPTNEKLDMDDVDGHEPGS